MAIIKRKLARSDDHVIERFYLFSRGGADPALARQSVHSGVKVYQFFGTLTWFRWAQLEAAGWTFKTSYRLWHSGKMEQTELHPMEDL